LALPKQEEGVAIEASKTHSAELLRWRTQQDVAQAQIDMAQAGLYPTVALAHRQNLGGQDNTALPNRTYLSLQFSPGPGFSARSAAAAARSRLENSLQNTVVFERQIAEVADIGVSGAVDRGGEACGQHHEGDGQHQPTAGDEGLAFVASGTGRVIGHEEAPVTVRKRAGHPGCEDTKVISKRIN
jgi:hypothetical protein